MIGIHPWRWLIPLAMMACLPARAEPPASRWIAITTPALKPSLAPLADHRSRTGLRVSIIQTTDILTDAQLRAGDATPLRRHIVDLIQRESGPASILILGSPFAPTDDLRSFFVPALTGTIGRMKGRPSDNAFGCLDDRVMPTIPVGRLPARSVAEADAMVRKILAYERSAPPGEWRRRLTLIVGNPGGSSPIERALSNWYVDALCRTTLGRLDPAWSVRALFHIPGSPFHVPDAQLNRKAIERLSEGQAFACYLGHSSAGGFWSQGVDFLTRDDWAKINPGGKAGVLISCGCYSCQLPAARNREEGHGLAAMRNPAGPVAVIGAHGESYAAMGKLAFEGMLTCLERPDPPQRLGDVWLALTSGIASGQIDFLTFRMFDQADGSRGAIPLATQRLEHLEMWMLLGDPAMPLASLPGDIRLTLPERAAAGAPIDIQGELPAHLAAADVRISLERPLAALEGMALPADPLARYEAANRVEVATARTAAVAGRFAARLAVPAQARGPGLIVRVHARQQDREALTARRMILTPARAALSLPPRPAGSSPSPDRWR